MLSQVAFAASMCQFLIATHDVFVISACVQANEGFKTVSNGEESPEKSTGSFAEFYVDGIDRDDRGAIRGNAGTDGERSSSRAEGPVRGEAGEPVHPVDQRHRLFGTARLPMILQAEAAECGLACLAMVASFHGQRHTLAELRRVFSASIKGTTLKSLMEMADTLGLTTRPVRLELEELRRLVCPVILHWDLGHFVVMSKAGRDWIEVHDPARGRIRLKLADASRAFTGVALELTPTGTFVERKAVEKVRLSDLWSKVRGLAPYLWQLGLLALALQVFAVISPMLNQMIIDDAIMKGDMGLLTTIGVGMVVLMLIQTLIGLVQGFAGLYLGTQLTFQMKTNLLRHALRLPVEWFEKRHLGDILTRFSSLGPAQAFMTSAPVSVPLNIVMLLAGGTMAVLYSPVLFACAVAAMLIPFLVQWAVFPWVKRKTDEGLTLSARASTVFMETLRGARTFKLQGRDRVRVAQWQNDEAEALNNSVTLARVGLWGGAGLGIVTGLQGVAIWWLGASQVIEGAMSLGMLMAFQSYSGQFTGAVRSLIGTWFEWKELELHLERLADVIHQDAETGADDPVDPARRFDGEVSARGLSFRYATHEPLVLHDVNLTVRPGEFVAIVGPSGGGKSTLLKLLVGILRPTDGAVCLDGVGLSQFGLRTYRSRIAAVLQDDRLFQGTIAENVSFFDESLDMARVERSLIQACVYSEIMAMPMGLQTLVGDLGNALSGGQQQRVLIARALYRQPQVLFLDEGTANLDPETERKVIASFAALGCTRIVVAHRPAAIERADRVLAVTQGRVEEVVLEPRSRQAR